MNKNQKFKPGELIILVGIHRKEIMIDGWIEYIFVVKAFNNLPPVLAIHTTEYPDQTIATYIDTLQSTKNREKYHQVIINDQIKFVHSRRAHKLICKKITGNHYQPE